MFNTLTDLTGLRIDDSRMIEFMEKNGFKYPKKPFISNRSTETTYWVENKKLGIDLLFSARTYLDNYPLIPGDKKGIYVPVLSRARWYNNKSNTTFPQDLDFNHDFESLKLKLGEPTLKSSDISPVWLNDDGSESFYRWSICLDEGKDIFLGLEFTDDQTINDFTLGLKYQNPLFYLYDEWVYEDVDRFLQWKNFHKTAHLMFLQWAIERDLIKTTDSTTEAIQQVKAGAAPVTAWVSALNRGYVLASDFSAEAPFIKAYINNLSGHDILYNRDISYTFLNSAELKQNYFGEAATQQLNEVVYNEANYTLVKSLIDSRLAEYKIHRFSRSKQL
ncbi:hypothetical protein [Chitinophaga sp. HK235]|uniref:hypothetical protein n=1 Tax=Chitinophaga sp. HK235 TaxID=2952571 RepID=UPI001BAE4F2B|nr:hypothetical protein [Chitinophaga sp. HK235]